MKTLCIMLVAAVAYAQPLKFTGEVKAGDDFRKSIGRGLYIEVVAAEDGWRIEVRPEKPALCDEFSSVVAIPLRGRQASMIDTSYGVSAAEAVKRPYGVDFVLDEKLCTEESTRRDILLWSYSYPKNEADEALAKFRSSPMGTADLRILNSKITPTGGEVFDGKDFGKIEWIKFEVTVKFPPRSTAPPALGRPGGLPY
jgi:hypothetical protein